MSARTITATVDAWMPSYRGPEDLQGDPRRAINSLAFAECDMSDMGWTRIGTADVALHIVDENQLIENKVESLRAEQTKTRADAQAKVTELERQIQQLLAIEHTPEGDA